MDIVHRQYRPERYSDDLHVLPEQMEAWHVYVNAYQWYEVKRWLEENNIQHESHFTNLVLFKESDVMHLKLRWS